MNNRLWIVAIAILSNTAACNETIGDCYPVGQSGGSGDPGVGATGSTGSGPPSGDGPLGQSQSALSMAQCNGSDNETPVHAGPTTPCPISDWGPMDGTTYDYCDSACVAQCGSALALGTFGSSSFKFVTTMPEGSKTRPGGWQVASATLSFDRWTGLLPETWTCSIVVGMPLRSKVNGSISPAYAAVASADIANRASSYLMHNPEEIPQGAFCALFPDAMNNAFMSDPIYTTLGARVTKPGQAQ